MTPSRGALALVVCLAGACRADAPGSSSGSAPAVRVPPALVEIDVRDVGLDTVIGDVAGEPLRARELDPRARDALRALWQKIHAAKQDALERCEDAALLRARPLVPEPPGSADTLGDHLAALRVAREARAAHLAGARAATEIARFVPGIARDRETPWPGVVARVGTESISDEDLESGARLRLARLRGRVHAELVRAFEAAADARRRAGEEARRGAPLPLAVEPVSDAEVEGRMHASPALAAAGRPDRVRAYLEGRRRVEAELALRDALRARVPAHFLVRAPAPLRLDVAGARPGPADPPVVLLAYTGLRCRHCAEAERVLSELAREPGSERLRIERRAHFPEAVLPALRDAIAESCAARQGVDAALRAGVLASLARTGEADAEAIARASAPDALALERCLRDPAVRARALARREEAAALGLDETPSFLVNGVPLVGLQSREDLAQVVSEALHEEMERRAQEPEGGSS